MKMFKSYEYIVAALVQIAYYKKANRFIQSCYNCLGVSVIDFTTKEIFCFINSSACEVKQPLGYFFDEKINAFAVYPQNKSAINLTSWASKCGVGNLRIYFGERDTKTTYKNKSFSKNLPFLSPPSVVYFHLKGELPG